MATFCMICQWACLPFERLTARLVDFALALFGCSDCWEITVCILYWKLAATAKTQAGLWCSPSGVADFDGALSERQALLGTWPKRRPPSRLTKAQAKALDSLAVSISNFLAKTRQKLEIEHPKLPISTKGLECSGAEVKMALPLIAKE